MTALFWLALGATVGCTLVAHRRQALAPTIGYEVAARSSARWYAAAGTCCLWMFAALLVEAAS